MGENSGPAPAPENRINSIPTVKVTADQARMYSSLLSIEEILDQSNFFQVIISSVLSVWTISKKMMTRKNCLVHIIFTKNVYHVGFDL